MQEQFVIVQQFVRIAHAMTTIIMAKTCNEKSISEIEHYIKIFLSWTDKYGEFVAGQAFEDRISKPL